MLVMFSFCKIRSTVFSTINERMSSYCYSETENYKVLDQFLLLLNRTREYLLLDVSKAQQHVLSSGCREIHPLLGTKDTGGLGMPSGKEERESRHQRQNIPGQDRVNSLSQHVLKWGAR